jgi:hypothetical protein
LLASAMLVGSALGQLLGVATSLLFHPGMRPVVAVALVVGIPSAIGLSVILFSGRRWVTMFGAGILALAPGWFGMLVALRVVAGG